MPSICAWCKTALNDAVNDLGPLSHGICKPCLVAMEYQPQPLAAFLESLPGPVMAVNADGRVVSGNERLLGMVQKEQSAALDRLGGEVISCIYSELPGGCGQTVHCLGCSIRNAVNETRDTRQSKMRVPAYAYVRTPDGGVVKLDLRISTECAGNLVLLRVDEAEPGPSDRPDIR
jgi:PAS domain-containing protein